MEKLRSNSFPWLLILLLSLRLFQFISVLSFPPAWVLLPTSSQQLCSPAHVPLAAQSRGHCGSLSRVRSTTGAPAGWVSFASFVHTQTPRHQTPYGKQWCLEHQACSSGSDQSSRSLLVTATESFISLPTGMTSSSAKQRDF